MQMPSIFVFTHDSIGLGQDGPTHQPMEQIASLRAMPEFTDFRPADANETAAAWQVILERKQARFSCAFTAGPARSRSGEKYDILNGVRHGAYVLRTAEVLAGRGVDCDRKRSESDLESAAVLESQGMHVRVVSMPSWRLFDEQTGRISDENTAVGVPRLVVEAASTDLAGGRSRATAVMCWDWIDLAHLRRARSRWINLDSM